MDREEECLQEGAFKSGNAGSSFTHGWSDGIEGATDVAPFLVLWLLVLWVCPWQESGLMLDIYSLPPR